MAYVDCAVGRMFFLKRCLTMAEEYGNSGRRGIDMANKLNRTAGRLIRATVVVDIIVMIIVIIIGAGMQPF